MTARPIPFRAPMVRAILEGRKTMTRRVLKPRKGLGFPGQLENPRYEPGDTIWVREAWRTWAQFDDLPPRDIPPGSGVQYLADDPVSPWDSRYRHARFMPRWASRIDLRVIAVRVERLQDISEEDAMAEGVVAWHDDRTPPHLRLSDLREDRDRRDFLSMHYGSPRDAFAALWNDIHGPDAWDENPWVAAITFERIKP